MSAANAARAAMHFASRAGFSGMGRAAGMSAAQAFTRGALRATGSVGAWAWAAQAQVPRLPTMAQPTYGFAAQAIANVAVDAIDAGGSSGSSSSGITATGGGESDAECLPASDSEGVIPRTLLPPARAPPWTYTTVDRHLQQQQQQQEQQERPIGLPAALLADATHPLAAPRLPFDNTTRAQRLQLAAAAAANPWLSAHAPFSTSAAAAAAQAAGARSAGPGARGGATQHRHHQHHHQPQPQEEERHELGRHAHAPPLASAAAAEDAEDAGPRLSAEEYRAQHRIHVSDPSSPAPFQTFEDAPFPPAMLDVLRHARYSRPSSIQAQAWPVALSGRDLVAIASTGSGKTLGYLLPALLKIQEQGADPARGASVLVLAPTRELAKQIEVEALRFANVVLPEGLGRQQQHAAPRRRQRQGLRTACLYGGASRERQSGELYQRPHIVIATPGRLLDFIEAADISLRQVSYLVLDEADRMLDMGFEPQIAAVARSLPPQRQTLFFSATWPVEVRKAAESFATQRPVHVFIGDVQDKPVAAKTITQHVRIVEGKEEKFEALEGFLREVLLNKRSERGETGAAPAVAGARPEQGRVIVFCRTKSACDTLAHSITSTMPFQAATLHGDKSQAARDYAMHQFRAGRVPVLVATDVAARGLDVPHVTAVVNFDMPEEIDMYVHRIGRTGRAGAPGDALTLLTRRDGGVARALVGVLEGAGQPVPPELEEFARANRDGGGGGGRGGRGGGRGGGDRCWGRGRRPGLWQEEGRGEGEAHRAQHKHADRWRRGERGGRATHAHGDW